MVKSLPVRKHLVKAFIVRAIHSQFICVFPGYLGGLLAPQVAAHAFHTHQFAGAGNVNAGFSPFMCLKFGHLRVLLLRLVYYDLSRHLRSFP